MTVKEVIDFLSKFQDDDQVYIDVHEGYWHSKELKTFDNEETGRKSPAIRCGCSLPVYLA